jgi:hypothetical protein
MLAYHRSIFSMKTNPHPTTTRIRAFAAGALVLLTIPQSAMAQSVDAFPLINAATDQPVAGFDPIAPGAVIDTTVLGFTTQWGQVPHRNISLNSMGSGSSS